MKNSSLLLILFTLNRSSLSYIMQGKGGDRLIRIAQFQKMDLGRPCFLFRIVLLSHHPVNHCEN